VRDDKGERGNFEKIKRINTRLCFREELSNILGVSRTAVWKCINELKKEGYVIDSSSKKGYKLCYVPDIINSWEIKEGLGTRIIGQNIHCFSEIDSTNNYAKYLLKRVAMTYGCFGRTPDPGKKLTLSP